MRTLKQFGYVGHDYYARGCVERSPSMVGRRARLQAYGLGSSTF